MRMIFVGWDSNPAVDVVDFDIGYGTRPPHAFVSAGTPLESVSTDLYALSRGFIPGGIMIPLSVETRLPHAIVSAGTQVPPQPVEVRSSGLLCFEQGIYPRRNCDTVGYGNRWVWRLDHHMRLYRRGLSP